MLQRFTQCFVECRWIFLARCISEENHVMVSWFESNHENLHVIRNTLRIRSIMLAWNLSQTPAHCNFRLLTLLRYWTKEKKSMSRKFSKLSRRNFHTQHTYLQVDAKNIVRKARKLVHKINSLSRERCSDIFPFSFLSN